MEWQVDLGCHQQRYFQNVSLPHLSFPLLSERLSRAQAWHYLLRAYKVNFKLLTTRKRSNPLTHLPIFSILCPSYPPKSLERLQHAHTTRPHHTPYTPCHKPYTIYLPTCTMCHTYQTTHKPHHIYTHRNWVCCYISTKSPPYLSFCCLSALELGFSSLFQD